MSDMTMKLLQQRPTLPFRRAKADRSHAAATLRVRRRFIRWNSRLVQSQVIAVDNCSRACELRRAIYTESSRLEGETVSVTSSAPPVRGVTAQCCGSHSGRALITSTAFAFGFSSQSHFCCVVPRSLAVRRPVSTGVRAVYVRDQTRHLRRSLLTGSLVGILFHDPVARSPERFRR